jgi:hypothetical protein
MLAAIRNIDDSFPKVLDYFRGGKFQVWRQVMVKPWLIIITWGCLHENYIKRFDQEYRAADGGQSAVLRK